MQTQSKVRFYITQADDQPIVRTIPVAKVAVEAAVSPEPSVMSQSVPAAVPAVSQKKKVAGLVRSAVKRTPLQK